MLPWLHKWQHNYKYLTVDIHNIISRYILFILSTELQSFFYPIEDEWSDV